MTSPAPNSTLPTQMVALRELRVAARKPGNYWLRVAAGAFAALALLPHTGGISNGRNLFFSAVVLATIACVVEAARRASASIASEKNEGTLGLLLMTPLTGTGLFRGKFMAIVVSVLPMALAAVPVLAASLLLGGVSGGEFLRALVAIAHIVMLVIALGICISARQKNPDAGFIATLAMVVFAAGPLTGCANGIPDIRSVNPMTPLLAIPDGEFARTPIAFFLSIFLWQGFAWSLLQMQGARLTQTLNALQEETFRETAPARAENWQHKSRAFAPARLNYAPRWFKENPMEWFTMRHLDSHSNRWTAVFISVVMGIMGVLFHEMGRVFLIFALPVLGISLAIASARSMARLKESGALELLLTTPLSDRGILEGHRRGLRKVFMWPFLIWVAVMIFLFRPFLDDAGWLIPAYFGAGVILLAWATPWFGVAAALKTKTSARAAGATIFFTLVLPRLFMCYMGDAIYFAIAGPFVRNYVRKNFRRLVAERFGS